MNYLARHWRGELPLVIAFWINVPAAIGGLYLLNTLLDLAPEDAMSNAPVPLALAGAFIFCALAPVAVWAIVGAWRAATAHAKAGGSRAGSISARVVLAVIGLMASAAFASSIPVTVELMRIAFGGGYDGESAEVRVMRGGTELEIRGPIGFGLSGRVEEALDDNPGIKVVHLFSPGGRAVEGRRLSALIKGRGLTTYVRTRCASACITAYLGGARRLADERAEFAFHRSGLKGEPDQFTPSEDAADRDVYVAAGVKPEFVDRVHATPHAEAWEPPLPEVIAAGVVHATAPGDEFALTGYDRLSDEDIERMVLEIPMNTALQERDPAAFAEVLKIYRDAFREGRSIRDVRDAVAPILARALPQ